MMLLLEVIAQIPQASPLNGMPVFDAGNIERASMAIHDRAREAVELLQHYVNSDQQGKRFRKEHLAQTDGARIGAEAAKVHTANGAAVRESLSRPSAEA